MSLPPGASVTTLRFDSTENKLLAGFQNGMVLVLNDSFAITDTFGVIHPVSDARIVDGKLAILEIGRLLPSDLFKGRLTAKDFHRRPPDVRQFWLQELNRPVEFQFANLVGSSLPEVIICEYGNRVGSLFWCERDSAGNPGERHVLSNMPGARTVIPCDADKDGRTDLLALFAQGNERVALFKNKGNGIFEEKNLLRFPPVNGSSFLELADMDADGDPDLVLSNGDNGDYSIVLKPWHGVRIFENDGNWNYSEKWFHPMNGVGKTITRDFDGDGDFDIAAISYFPDFGSNPQEGFVFFENKGSLKFEPFSMPEAKLGRWLVMDAGDFDGDGDEDLALGSCITGPRMGIPPELTWEWAEENVAVLVLLNKIR
ncbi:MAG: VCBS repeat-containing protein [Bacteroidota bacterium]